MAYNGKEGSEITIEQGADLTANYRDNNPGAELGHFFGKDILMQMLEQQGCMGIRMYYGQNDRGGKELVIVGADADENDLTDFIGDVSSPCPPCGAPNPLNGQ